MRRATLLSFLLFLTAPCLAQSPQRAGDIRALVPTGHIVRGGAPRVEAKRNDPVFWQDIVRTEPRGRVRIGLLDGSILNVGSESQLQITQHDATSQNTTIDLLYGKVRAQAVRLSRPNAQFRIRTPVAHAGVVGTRFIVRSFPAFTEIICLDGSVRVRNRDESIPGEVLVRAGEFTRVGRGLPPTPPAQALPNDIRDAEEETDLPAAPEISRVEISWPPAGCGLDAQLLLRAWAKQLQEGKEIEVPVDGELLTGSLRLGAETLYVEGGRASLSGPPSSQPPEGAFTPAGKTAGVPARIYPPLELATGEGWRAPRAVFTGNAFYVLGPMGFAGTAQFRFGETPATLLWQGPCGAGFLSPHVIGAEYDVTLSLGGAAVARGKMNLIDVSYRVPVPPSVLRGQETNFGIDLRGLAGLDRFTDGRPVITVVLTNTTPMIIGNLRSSTRGAKAIGEEITYLVSGGNVDAGGAVRLDGSARGRQGGMFNLNVKLDLDAALEKPRTPLTPLPSH